ncbi:MAG TPA: DUF4340 domain-containing protein [Gammaproteobacteria bacterium]|nr:DUF4340 domain-containing protein [Gammaproteobacteria bacterium]
MLSARSFTALCLLTACVVVAATLVSGDSDAIPGSGKPLFPDLMSRLNDIEQIQIGNAPTRFVLERSDGGWIAPDKFGYPADADKIHKLVVGTAGLKRVEPKTSDPDRYPKLGLADSGEKASAAMSYRLKSGNDSTIAALIVGNSAPAKGDPDLSEFYVRVADDPRAWLVAGKLPRGDDLLEWLDRTVADIDRVRVRQTQVAHASGEVVTVTRESPAKEDFLLPDAPPSKTVDGQWKLNDIGRLFSSLELEDVRPKEDAPIEGEPDYVVTTRTFDGLVVRMEVFKPEQQAFGVLTAEFHPTEARVEGAPAPKESLASAEAVRAEAGRLNARWARWAYALPAFKLDALARSQAELLKDPADDKQPDQG